MVDDKSQLEFVMFATSTMKANFNLFPEVLFIDGTYSVNKLHMPLYTLLVEDGDGVGRVAAYCFVCNERKCANDAVLKQFSTPYNVSMVNCDC